MLVGKTFVYVHLQKTGGTFISNELMRAFPDSRFVGNKHDTLNSFFRLKIEGKKLLIGSNRDKYDWYRSLWSYGCDGKGGLRERILNSRNIYRTIVKLILFFKFKSAYNTLRFHNRVKNQWLELLEKDDDRNFLRWFHLINHKDAQYLIGEPIPKYFGKNGHVGLYTRRFFKTYFVSSNIKYSSRIDAILKVDFLINQSTLGEDLTSVINLIEERGERKNHDFVISNVKINTSKKTTISNEVRAQIIQGISILDNVF